MAEIEKTARVSVPPPEGSYTAKGDGDEFGLMVPAPEGTSFDSNDNITRIAIALPTSVLRHRIIDGFVGAGLTLGLGGIVAAVVASGIAQPVIGHAKDLLGWNATTPSHSAAATPGAVRMTPKPAKSAVAKPTSTKTTKETKTPQQCVAELDDTTLIGQTLALGMQLSDGEKKLSDLSSLYNAYHIGAFVVPKGLLDADYNTTNKTLLDFIAAQDITPDIDVTQEFGSITRVPTFKIQSEAVVGKMNDAQVRYFLGGLKKAFVDMKQHGITTVFGLVVDEADPDKSGPMKGRTFSKDPNKVAKLALLYLQTAKEAGIDLTLKHGPGGLGTAKPYDKNNKLNTDFGPMFTDNWDKISKDSLTPYQAVRNIQGITKKVMIETTTIPGLTTSDKSKQMPAVFSKKAVDVTKTAMSPDDPNSVISYTDDLATRTIVGKNGMHYTLSEAVVKALQAGNNYIEIGHPSGGKTWQELLDTTITAAQAAMLDDPALREQIQGLVLANLKAKNVDPCEVVG